MSRGTREELLPVLYLTIFLNSSGLGTSSFLIPVYAEELGAGYVDMGLIGAVGNIVYLMGTILTGYLLDRVERVQFYLLSTLAGCVVVISFALTSSIGGLTFVRGFLGAVSAAFWVTASTLTADISSEESLTRSMGRYNLAWISGFVAGPLLGGYISEEYGFPVLFLSLSSMMVFSIFVILLRIKPKLSLSNHGGGELMIDLSVLLEMKWAYTTLVPFTLILGIYMAIIPGHMRFYGIPSFVIGFLLTLTNGVRGVAFFNVERFDAWGVRRSLFLSSFLLFISMYIMSLASEPLYFALSLTMYGVAAGIITPLVLDVIARDAPRDSLGMAMGVHEGVYGIGMCLGPMVGGWIAESFSPARLYLGLSGLSLVILPLAWILTGRQR